MGRLVNCFDTGGKIDRDKAYIQELAHNKKRFWSSHAAYETWVKDNDAREACIETLKEILGYDQAQMKLPTLTYKKIAEYAVYGFDVLLNTINRQTQAFHWALTNKQFNSETAKVQYFFAIINNNIMDEYKLKKNNQKTKEVQEKQAEYLEDIQIVNRKQSSTNISQWLGED